MGRKNEATPIVPQQMSLTRWKGHRWVALPLRVYLGWIFIAASLHKIAHPGSFALAIATYDILPLAWVNPLAIILPYVEIVAGVMLMIGLRTRAAALMIAAMMLMFTVAVGIAMYQGIDASCGCFAAQALDDDPIGWRTVLRDVIWLLMAVYIMLFDRQPLGLDRWLGASRSSDA